MSWLPELSERRQRQVLGILLLALAGLLIASLASYIAPVPGSRPWAEANASGPLGAWLAHLLYQLLGRLFAWGVPILALAIGWNRLRGNPVRSLAVRSVVLSLISVEILALIGLFGESARGWGGSFGLSLAGGVQSLLGTAGGAITLSAALLATVLVASELGFSAVSLAWAYGVREPLRSLWGHLRDGVRDQKQSWLERREARRQRVEEMPPAGQQMDLKVVKPRVSMDAMVPATDGENTASTPGPLPLPAMTARAATGLADGTEERENSRPVKVRESAPQKPRAARKAVPDRVEHSGALPSLDLLETHSGEGVRIVEADLRAEADLLTSRLADFGIRGAVTEVHPGPVVTTFEFAPAPGIKVSQITSREDDLALAMRARRIRILAPIPGKGAVGVEIPNRNPRTVYFREVMGSDTYRRMSAKLKIALGVDVNGIPTGADLTTMPHLLVAGATGSGKSVYLNVLITSLLFEKGPDDLRLLMIDPKMIELTAYNGIPHLLMPVVTEAKRAARSLRWAVGEMERRYKQLAASGARNIDGFNKKISGPSPPVDEEGKPFEPLPYIVIIVDELADLMLTMPVEMEEPIGRLAQMARAVGIHLVLATQRPSVDVITGVIKANFPSRIAFQVSSKTDSRTILDMNGAENLLGRGDMLYLPSGQPEGTRIHAPFASENEVARVVEFWRERAPAKPGPTPIEEAVEQAAEQNDDDEDDLVPDAVRLVVLHQQGSTSLLQRRLKVGYSRASRLMDRLEAIGVVGPFMGSKAREVLVDESYLEENSLR